MLPANHTCARTPGAVSGSVYFPVLVAEEAAKATLVQGIRPCSCSQCPPPFPLTSRPFPWSLLVTNGHKCIPDIPGHLLVDGVLHIIVGHPDELLEDWPQEKPRRLGVSDSSERGGSPLPCPSSSARKVEGAPGMTTAQGLGVLDRITTGWKFRWPRAQSKICVKADSAPEPRTNSRHLGWGSRGNMGPCHSPVLSSLNEPILLSGPPLPLVSS